MLYSLTGLSSCVCVLSRPFFPLVSAALIFVSAGMSAFLFLEKVPFCADFRVWQHPAFYISPPAQYPVRASDSSFPLISAPAPQWISADSAPHCSVLWPSPRYCSSARETHPCAHLPCGFDMYDCIPAVHRDMPDYTLTSPVSPSDL